MKHYKLGWKKSLPGRDQKYGLHLSTLDHVASLPKKVDLREQMSPVEDQGQLGSCVANALVGALEFLELAGLKGNESLPEEFGATFEDLSRLFVYFNARYIDGDTSSDEGTTTRSAIQALQKWGVCREKVWPYQINAYSNTPLKVAYQEAISHKILADYRIDNSQLNQMLSCLALGFPFVFGISVYDSFMQSQDGVIPMPGADESVQGGHALCCVGYDLDEKTFLFRNSWGSDWGAGGYGTIPFDYLTSTDLCDDVWTIRKK